MSAADGLDDRRCAVNGWSRGFPGFGLGAFAAMLNAVPIRLQAAHSATIPAGGNAVNKYMAIIDTSEEVNREDTESKNLRGLHIPA